MSKPQKTHTMLETRLRPGESKTLFNGTVITNSGETKVKLRVMTPIEMIQGKASEPKKI